MNETIQAVAQAAAGPIAGGVNWESAFPALIGFIGVLVGGIINVAAQRRNFNEEQVASIRERVAELVVLVQDYSTAAKQAHDTLQNHAAETNEHGVITLDERGSRLFSVLGTEFFQLYRKALVLSIRLMSARDRKIADQAQEVQDSLNNFHADFANLFEYKLTTTRTGLDDACGTLIRTCDQMLNMIEPRYFESFTRFRSIKKATKILDDHAKKRDEERRTHTKDA